MDGEPTLEAPMPAPGTPRPPTGARRELARLAITGGPIAAVGILTLAISLTDMVMMAWLDRRALSAGALVSDVYSLCFQFAAGALSSVTPHVARAHADGEPQAVRAVVARYLGFAAVLALVGGVPVWHTPALLSALGIELPLSAQAADYARYMSGSFGLMLVVALARWVLPALGKGVVPMWVMAAAVPLNALADGVLMWGWLGAPRMGLGGAGAASLLVAIACVIALVLYVVGTEAMRVFTRTPRASRPSAPMPRRLMPTPRPRRLMPTPRPRRLMPTPRPRRLMKEGLMTGAASLCETGLFLSSTVLVAIFEPRAVPAHVVIFRSLAITYALLFAYGQAVTIHVSIAARRDGTAIDATGGAAERSRSVVRAAIAGGAILCAGYALALCAMPSLPLPSATHGDLARLARLAPWAALAASSLVPAVLSFAIQRARFRVSAPTAIGLLAYWGLGFPTMLVLGGLRAQGALGVWIGLAAGAAACALARCAHHGWSRTQAPRTEPAAA